MIIFIFIFFKYIVILILIIFEHFDCILATHLCFGIFHYTHSINLYCFFEFLCLITKLLNIAYIILILCYYMFNRNQIITNLLIIGFTLSKLLDIHLRITVFVTKLICMIKLFHSFDSFGLLSNL